MAIAPFENALLQKFSETGSDGTTDNDSRTSSLYVGGHVFTIVLKDSAGVQSDLKVQVNNSNALDPNKPHHAVTFQQLQNVSMTTQLIKDGIFDPADPRKESSASAADFDTNWIDVPGGAVIDSSDVYVSSGSYRFMRLKSTSEMNATLSAYIWSREF